MYVRGYVLMDRRTYVWKYNFAWRQKSHKWNSIKIVRAPDSYFLFISIFQSLFLSLFSSLKFYILCFQDVLCLPFG